MIMLFLTFMGLLYDETKVSEIRYSSFTDAIVLTRG